MSLRDWLEQNKAVSVIVIVLLMGAAVAVYLWTNRSPVGGAPTQGYYYDIGLEGDAALFAGDLGGAPPIPAPSGKKQDDGSPGGARAFVFSCGSCDDPAQRFIGYIETHTADAKQATEDFDKFEQGLLPAGQGQSYDVYQRRIDRGHIVAKPQSPLDWKAYRTNEGQAIIQEARSKCPPEQLKECFPKK